ncbi:MAG: GntR family transcriptional regulator, partial [Burkholderiales bacterium]
MSTSLPNLGSLPIARYHQIYLVLREQILEGQFRAERALPGDLELATQFGVSRITVRTALDRLVDEQLIERHRGRGTFVRSVARAPTKGRAQMSGLLENIVMMGLKTTVRVIDLAKVPAPSDVAEMLHIAPGTLVQKAIRVRSHKGAPVSHITTFVPATLAAGFGRRELGAKPMLTLLEESGV